MGLSMSVDGRPHQTSPPKASMAMSPAYVLAGILMSVAIVMML